MLSFAFEKQLGSFVLQVEVNAASRGVIALFGRSGCGKSSVVNLLAGLMTAERGHFTLDGDVLFESKKGINQPTEQRRIGYVFQDARLFPHFTVRGNLEYGLRRARQSTNSIDFDTVVALLELGPLLKRRPHHLSGGEKQRVALGRALLAQPRLLLLDEPLASLDQSRRNEVLPYLENMRDELAIPMVYVSHQFDEVLRLATHVVLLDNGRVSAQGDLPTISLEPALRNIVGADAIGSVVESEVRSIDATTGFAHVSIGTGYLNVEHSGLQTGQRVRLQLLARDLILSLHAPVGLSVRNSLQGTLTRLVDDGEHARLVSIDVGGVTLVARVTRAATEELQLHAGMSLWVLVKAITLRGHVFHAQGNTSVQS